MQRSSFLVRIWREKGQAEWQGWVQHIRSGESAPFTNLGDLLAFIERHSGKLAEPHRKGLK